MPRSHSALRGAARPGTTALSDVEVDAVCDFINVRKLGRGICRPRPIMVSERATEGSSRTPGSSPLCRRSRAATGAESNAVSAGFADEGWG